ncbi:MAG: outer membrane lipoprotein-sorting protein [Flavobacteriaceae bacterium]|nr:outer membrane lipoprotein-sorting protein [Flavobacteriaceae bacterium]
MKKITLFVLAIFASFTINAQTADEIINTYFENIGGLENMKKVEGIKMAAKVNQQGMEIPLEIIQLKGGKQMTVINFQGKEIKQGVFDGETLWSTNFMTMKAEKSDAEATANMKLEINDFLDPFIDYKEKNYTIELLGNETIDGAETFKIKLTKEPVTIDGKKEDSISFYFFDTENFVPIAVQSEMKSGQAKGMISEVTFSDYQEVDGIYFPFSMTQGVKGQPGSPLTITSIELNPKIDDSVFAFPEEIITEEKPVDEKK